MKLFFGAVVFLLILPLASAHLSCGDGSCRGAETRTLYTGGESPTITLGDEQFTVSLSETSDTEHAVIVVNGYMQDLTKNEPTVVNDLLVTLTDASHSTDSYETNKATFIFGENPSTCSSDCSESSTGGGGSGSVSGSGSGGAGGSSYCGDGVCQKETVRLTTADGERVATLTGISYSLKLVDTIDERTAHITINGETGTLVKGSTVAVNGVNVYLAGIGHYPDYPEKEYVEMVLGESIYSCSKDCGPVCGNGICEDGEKTTCQDDCAIACTAVYQPLCGKDGVTYSNECFLHAAGAAFACKGECPCTNTLPESCTEVKDDSGTVHVICSTVSCPVISSDASAYCEKQGGHPEYREVNGCKIFSCQFSSSEVAFLGGVTCPDPAGIEKKIATCESQGLKGVVIVQNGCKIGTCIAPGLVCPVEESLNAKDQKERECISNGLHPILQFDDHGCRTVECGDETACMRSIPEEAYKRCSNEAGKLVFKRASEESDSCIDFVECIRPSRSEDIQYQKVESVPSTEKLLAVALKMEQLKQTLRSMVEKTTALKEYYVGQEEEKTFEKVSILFQQALDEIESIKVDLRTKVENDAVTTSDLETLKLKIKTIRSILKNALLELLGSKEDKQEVVEDVQSNPDVSFEDAFTTCTPVSKTFDEQQTTVQILGIDGVKCKIHVQTVSGLDMTCSVPNFALGMNTQDIANWGCTGSLAESLAQARNPTIVNGPNGCGDQCVSYCREHVIECRQWCAEHPDQCTSSIREVIEETTSSSSSGAGEPTSTILPGEPLPPERLRECTVCVDDGVCGETECSTCSDCQEVVS